VFVSIKRPRKKGYGFRETESRDVGHERINRSKEDSERDLWPLKKPFCKGNEMGEIHVSRWMNGAYKEVRNATTNGRV
jgi:hypothetical protein